MELNLRKKYSLNVVAIICNDDVTINIAPEKPLEKSMRLIVIGSTTKLKRM